MLFCFKQDLSNAETLSFACDESADGNKDPIINFMVAGSNAGPFLMDTIWPTTESQNADYFKKEMEKLQEVEKLIKRPVKLFFCLFVFLVDLLACLIVFDCVCLCFVCVCAKLTANYSDNCATMKASRKEWNKESKRDGIWNIWMCDTRFKYCQ